MQNKNGVLVIIIALTAVLGIAFFAYNSLVLSGAGRDINLSAEANASTSEGEESAANDTAASSTTENTAGSSETNSASSETLSKLADFNVIDREGNTVALSSMYGKPTLLGFWATWCPPCTQEAPEIQKLYNTYGDRVNFMMVDAASNGRDTPEIMEQWMTNNNYSYPVYIDTTGEAALATNLYYLPTMFVLDKEGNVLTAFSGALDETSGAQLIEQLLAL